MSVPIVIQLQELASDSNCNISDLLNKAFLVSTKLNLSEFRKWVSQELNGYAPEDELPSYRLISGDLRAQNPYRGLIPFIIPYADLMETICQIRVSESLSSINHLLSDQNSGSICFFFPPEAEAALMGMQDGFSRLRPVRVVSPSQLVSIVHAVRTRVLDWALTLEREGILGDGLTFSNKEREIAVGNQNIRIENFQGVLGNIHGGQVTQTNTLTVTAGNFESLSRYLSGQGIGTEDLKSLENAIKEDPEPNDPKKLGAKVSDWIGGMIAKAASGSWQVSLSAAGTILAAAIQKFYGL